MPILAFFSVRLTFDRSSGPLEGDNFWPMRIGDRRRNTARLFLEATRIGVDTEEWCARPRGTKQTARSPKYI